MKDAEDEAFDELAKKQGSWGGGFQTKRRMAAEKVQEPVLDIDGHVVGKMRKPKPAQEPLIDRLRKTASKGVSVWGDLMLEAADALAQPAQEPVAREWNFCERCGKRTKDLTTIHTCTPPQEGK